jgi:phage gp36-like protein
MAFLLKEDFPASVHDDILDALTKGDDDVITDNIDRTIDEIKAYLNGRYDIVATFAAEGNDRNKFILRLANTISLYWIYCVHNPRKLTQVMVKNYEDALETLRGIQKGSINPEGLPLPANETDANSGTGAPIQWGGAEQQDNSW